MSRLREHVEGLCVDEFVTAFGEAFYVSGQRRGIAGNVDDPFGAIFKSAATTFSSQPARGGSSTTVP